jgi:hypothetical protein
LVAEPADTARQPTAELGIAPAPVTLIGVAALFESDVLVEIEATAITDR